MVQAMDSWETMFKSKQMKHHDKQTFSDIKNVKNVHR